MNEPIPAIPTAPTTSQGQLTQDVLSLAQLGKQVLDARNAGGGPAVLKELGLDFPQLEQIAGDVVSNLPAIKAGLKTSEFYVAVLSLPVINILWMVLFKTHASPDINGAVTLLAGSYVGSRAVLKAKHLSAVATIATMKTAQVSKVETVIPSGSNSVKSTTEITSSGPAPITKGQ